MLLGGRRQGSAAVARHLRRSSAVCQPDYQELSRSFCLTGDRGAERVMHQPWPPCTPQLDRLPGARHRRLEVPSTSAGFGPRRTWRGCGTCSRARTTAGMVTGARPGARGGRAATRERSSARTRSAAMRRRARRARAASFLLLRATAGPGRRWAVLLSLPIEAPVRGAYSAAAVSGREHHRSSLARCAASSRWCWTAAARRRRWRAASDPAGRGSAASAGVTAPARRAGPQAGRVHGLAPRGEIQAARVRGVRGVRADGIAFVVAGGVVRHLHRPPARRAARRGLTGGGGDVTVESALRLTSRSAWCCRRVSAQRPSLIAKPRGVLSADAVPAARSSRQPDLREGRVRQLRPGRSGARGRGSQGATARAQAVPAPASRSGTTTSSVTSSSRSRRPSSGAATSSCC